MNSNRHKRFAAQNLVEFALVGPLFFLLVFGLIEGAMLAWTYNTLTNATKEGARYALVHGSRSDDIADADEVKTHMLEHSTGLSDGSLIVSLVWVEADGEDTNEDDVDNDPGDRVRIESTYEHTFILSYIFGTGSIDLSATSEVMIQH